MEGKELVASPANAGLLEKVVIEGDLAKLSPGDRVLYYRKVCESIGVNPYTKPFSYIYLNNKLVLYANRDCTDQLRRNRKVSITKLDRERVEDVYVVTAYATDTEGRTDSSMGAVSIGALKGEALANAMMKAETKSKRRVTLSIVGLGWLDETEIQSVPDAKPADVDVETGEIAGVPKTAVAPTNAPSPLAGRASPALWQAYNKLEHAALDWNNEHTEAAVALPEVHDKSSADDVKAAGVKLRDALEAAKVREAERRDEAEGETEAILE